MLIKIFMLMAVMYYYINCNDPKKAAVFWLILNSIATFIFEGFAFAMILWLVLSFIIAYAIFWVIAYSDGTPWHWPAFIGGIAGLFLFA